MPRLVISMLLLVKEKPSQRRQTEGGSDGSSTSVETQNSSGCMGGGEAIRDIRNQVEKNVGRTPVLPGEFSPRRHPVVDVSLETGRWTQAKASCRVRKSEWPGLRCSSLEAAEAECASEAGTRRAHISFLLAPMAQVFLKGRHSGIHSTVHKFQWSEPKMKPSTLPPLQQGIGYNKSKVKIFTRVQSGAQNQATTTMKSPRGLRKKEQLHMGKMQAKVRLMRSMLRNQRTSLQDLLNHESFLSKLNQELMKTIEDMEDSTGRNARAMLQQQGVLGNVIDILEYSNKKRVQQLKSELQEWEEKEEYKINGLQRQVDQMNAEIHKAHEEVGFLSTYMDHEYPVRSVQIASHKRQLQQAKDSQQDELDNLYEMRRSVLEYISNSIHQKKKNILRALMVKTQQPHQEMLLMKTRGSQEVRRCMVWFRELIEELNKEIPVLADEVERLQTELWEPRQIAFEDVLLHRPRCNPDMPVILRMPVEEQLPF